MAVFSLLFDLRFPCYVGKSGTFRVPSEAIRTELRLSKAGLEAFSISGLIRQTKKGPARCRAPSLDGSMITSS